MGTSWGLALRLDSLHTYANVYTATGNFSPNLWNSVSEVMQNTISGNAHVARDNSLLNLHLSRISDIAILIVKKRCVHGRLILIMGITIMAKHLYIERVKFSQPNHISIFVKKEPTVSNQSLRELDPQNRIFENIKKTFQLFVPIVV